MISSKDLHVTNAIDLAELAARAAEGLSYFQYFQEAEECQPQIEAGIALCNILIDGFAIDKSQSKLKAQDIHVWRAFEKVSEEVATDAEALEAIASEAGLVQKALSRIVEKKPVKIEELPKYRRFFLRLAVSLGL
jgi:hypothetical protein